MATDLIAAQPRLSKSTNRRLSKVRRGSLSQSGSQGIGALGGSKSGSRNRGFSSGKSFHGAADMMAHGRKTSVTVSPATIKALAHPGDKDHPATTPQEERGWCFYDVANGAFFYGVLNFLPLLLLNQARAVAEHAWCSGSHPYHAHWNETAGVGNYEACRKYGWAIDYENKGTCNVGTKGQYSTNTTCLANAGAVSICVGDSESWVQLLSQLTLRNNKNAA